jgi:hypothetical protein
MPLLQRQGSLGSVERQETVRTIIKQYKLGGIINIGTTAMERIKQINATVR